MEGGNMMVWREYETNVGGSYIQDVDLIYATKIYSVKRSGTGYERGFVNRGYIYSETDGRLYFNAVFEAGEKVFVWFETGGGPAPVCVPVTGSASFPVGAVGTSYYYDLSLSGTEPFSLTVNTKPAWMTVVLTGSHVYFTGNPTSAGAQTIDITVTNCSGGGTLNIATSFEVYDPPPPEPTEAAIRVENNGFTFTKVKNVYNFAYTTTSGAFPLSPGQQLLGVFAPFTGQIKVVLGPIYTDHNLVLRKNVAVIQSVAVPFSIFDQTVTFSVQTFADGDLIEIELNLA